jgi:hypothetical protein
MGIMLRSLVLAILTIALSSCAAKSTEGKALPSFASSSPEIFALNQLQAKAGEIVRVAGVNLVPGMVVIVGDKTIPLTILSSTLASFVMPDLSSSSSIGATFLSPSKQSLATMALSNGTTSMKIAVMDADPSLICSDVIYHDSQGRMKSGLRDCASDFPLCSGDGESDCATNVNYPAIDKNLVETQKQNIRSSLTVGGETGTLDNCRSDGDTDCKVIGPSYAAASTVGIATKIVAGETLAGVYGSAVTQPQDCTGDNQTNCTTTAAYPSVVAANVTAAVLKLGTSAAGVIGFYPSVSYPLASNTAATDLTNFSTQITTDGAFEFFDSTGAVYTASGDSDIRAFNLRASVALENLTLTGNMPTVLPKNPSPLTELYTSAPSNRIILNWQNTGATGYIVVRKTKAPVDFVPTQRQVYTTGAQGLNTILYVGSNTTYTDTAITLSNSYHYAVYAYNAANYYSSSPARASDMLNLCASAASGTWVAVPGDLVLNTGDFCAMKFHAKNVSSAAVSQAANGPYTNVTRTQAATRCQNIGSGYSLISNKEYLTISTNIARTASNWSGGAIGSGFLNSGHSDNSTGSCSASTDDTLAWVSGNCTPLSGTGRSWIYKRNHSLTNGQVIWDMGGNMIQFTSNDIDPNHKPYRGSDGGLTASIEFRDIDTDFSSISRSELSPTNGNYSFWNDSWGTEQGTGYFRPGTAGGGFIIARGNNWDNVSDAGVFSTNLLWDLNATGGYVSFRCTYHP